MLKTCIETECKDCLEERVVNNQWIYVNKCYEG